MFHHLFMRSGIGLPLAAGIVWGLFAFMTAMIRDDFVPPPASPQPELSPFIMPPVEAEPPRPEPDLPMETRIVPPPAIPAIMGAETDIGLPEVSFGGAVPMTIAGNLGDILNVTPVAIGERVAEPLSPPVVVYPRKMAQGGIEGRCDVHFSLDTTGRPFDVEAECTHAGFSSEAERAIRKVQFVPEIADGRPQIRRNVVYPLEFELSED